jgi:DNA (cytosine-5)-methyltransferase 1
MIRPNYILDLNTEIAVDNFAGGGGGSTGIEHALGRHVDECINHDPHALGMHRINHPQSIHHCEDVFEKEPSEICHGRPVGLAWFSPDCKHFSKAKGGKPLSKKIRGLAFVMLKWAKYGAKVLYMENVEEIQTWGPLLHHPKHKKDCACGKPCGKADPTQRGRTWRSFLAALGPGVDPASPDLADMLEVLNRRGRVSVTREELIQGFRYHVEFRELRACDYGAPTIRKRLFLIARKDGKPIVWPEPTHAKPEDIKRGIRLKPYRTVAECIDWSVPCHSIFLSKKQARAVRCKRPLATSSLRRMAKGVDRYVLKAKRPFLVNLTHQGSDERNEPIDKPMATITGARRGEKALVDASVTPFLSEQANASSQRNVSADKPCPTICAETKGGHWSLVSASLTREFGQSIGQPVSDPAPTTTAGGGGKSKLIAASLATHTTGHSGCKPSDPLKTIATGGHHALVTAHLTKFITGSVGKELTEPAPVITAGSHSPETHGGAASTLGLMSASLAHMAHGERDKSGKKRGRGAHAMDEQMPTVTASPDCALVAAHMVQKGHVHSNSDMVKGADEPMRTQATRAEHGVVAASLVKLRGNPDTHGVPGQPSDEPVNTISAGGQHHALSTAYLAQHNAGFNTNPGHDTREPMSTISAKGLQQQVVVGALTVYYGSEADGQALDESMRSVTSKARFGLTEGKTCALETMAPPASEMTAEQIAGAHRVAKFLRRFGVEFEGEFASIVVDGVTLVIFDLGMRMLLPSELFKAQGFPETYVIDRAWMINPKTGELLDVKLTKEQQIRMCGNSVSPPVAAALVAANNPEMCVRFKNDRRKPKRRTAYERSLVRN